MNPGLPVRTDAAVPWVDLMAQRADVNAGVMARPAEVFSTRAIVPAHLFGRTEYDKRLTPVGRACGAVLTEDAGGRILTLPLNPHTTETQQGQVAAALTGTMGGDIR